MGVWHRLRQMVRRRRPNRSLATYQEGMKGALDKIKLAELQMAQAGTLEELDLARSAMQQGYAEVQHLIRAAKRERGCRLRPVSECEAIHRRLLESLAGRKPSRSRNRSSRAG